MKWNMTPLENSADSDAEILLTGIAVVEIWLADPLFDVLAFAIGTNCAVLPQNPGEVVDSGLFIGKFLHHVID